MEKKVFNMKTKHQIENQNTAAWADILKVKKHSRVPIPSEFNTELAKEWVEENQK